jgi:hypothetical protein
MRTITTACIFLMLLTSSCSKNLLTYKYKRHFYEHSTFLNDSTFVQSISYNRRRVIDEEYAHKLIFSFYDIAAAKEKKILNLKTDRDIVKTSYDLFSVWNWEDENYELSGEIEILKWDKNKLKLKEKIKVIDHQRKETYHFVGKRTFSPAKKPADANTK